MGIYFGVGCSQDYDYHVVGGVCRFYYCCCVENIVCRWSWWWLSTVHVGVGVAVALGIVGNIAFFGTSTPNHKRAGHQNLVTTLRYIYGAGRRNDDGIDGLQSQLWYGLFVYPGNKYAWSRVTTPSDTKLGPPTI